MRRNEIISLLDGVGNCMDFIDGAEIRNTNTGETAGTIGEEVIHGMQVAIYICVRLLDGSLSTNNPMECASKIINTYAAAHLNLDRGEPDSGGEAEHKG